ncbi:DUF7569 family protein [Halopelagius fulvigenes]|uniref:Small CPxCG-related zinc finger protein n=1 Tax=Halopelagius fulvigenes TaxID=1198324 RepID=A0ABD5U359_9EURY
MSDADPCDACGTAVEDALSRTVRLSVDRSEIDSQRLCPNCFAEWIARYREEMQPESERTPVPKDGDADIIVD